MTDNFTIVFITGTILVIFLTFAIITFVILYTRSQLKFRVERQQFRQSLLEAEVEIRNVTLDMIARDLHDNLGQLASLIKINLSLMEEGIRADKRDRWKETRDLLSSLMDGMRSLTSELQSHELSERNLKDLMQRDIDRIVSTGVFRVDFKFEDENAPVPDADISLFLYRMFQEMMHNVIKHAEADRVEVLYQYLSGELLLAVKDNGRGFEINEAAGNGLRNLKERCKLINARVEIRSKPGNGTAIMINLPVKNKESS